MVGESTDIFPGWPTFLEVPQQSLMISSLHQPSTLGAMERACSQCGSGIGSDDLGQVSFTFLDLPDYYRGPIPQIREPQHR